MSVTEQHQNGTPSVSASAASDVLKEQGNKLFSLGKYSEALELYQAAITACPNMAVYHSNASACCAHLREYGQAAIFANEAIRLESSMSKAYFRRAVALMGLQQWKAALDDLRLVVIGNNHVPSAEVSSRMHDCEKELQKLAFAKAIHVDIFELDMKHIRALEVDAGYDGPRINDDEIITMDFVKDLIEWLREEKKLHPHYAYRIMYEARNHLKAAPNVVDLQVPRHGTITVCGDLHGQFFDLLHIFDINGYPSETHTYLFNGDLVDRGAYSIEVLLLVLALKVVYPHNFFLARGNHESESVNRMHGFFEEIDRKYGDSRMFSIANQVLHALPLVHIIEKQYFVVHGGLSQDALSLTIEDIKKIDRMKVPETGSLMSQLLWSDPQEENGIRPSHRGEGVLFGPDITKKFLARNGLKKIIRSHVWEPTGYKIQHDGQCITIFSAPNYTDIVSPAALINIRADLKFDFRQYDGAPFRGKTRKPHQFAGLSF